MLAKVLFTRIPLCSSRKFPLNKMKFNFSTTISCALLGWSSAFRINRTPFHLNRFLQSSVGEMEGVVRDPQVFIGNLPFDLDEDSITASIQEKVAGVKSIRMAKDRETGKFRGFCYVSFSEKEEAEAAVSALQGLEFDGRVARVDVSTPKEDRVRAPLPSSDMSVFVGNLDWSVTEDQLMDMCNDIVGNGLVSRIRISTDRNTGKPRGFCHIDFVSEEAATKAISELNGVNLLGRDIKVDKAQRRSDAPREMREPRGDRPPRQNFGAPRGDRQNSIFLGNLSWDVTQEMVEDMLNDVVGPNLFSTVRVAFDRETGRPRGFAHVDFKDSESAERAIVELNGMEVLGRQLKADHASRRE